MSAQLAGYAKAPYQFQHVKDSLLLSGDTATKSMQDDTENQNLQ